MQMCINVLVQTYTSPYFDKALEIIWAKPMYMQYIFQCGGGMVLLALDTFIVRRDSENGHMNLNLSAVCDCGIS